VCPPSNRLERGIVGGQEKGCPMLHLTVLGASVITSFVAGCQWASKLGLFGARSADWANQNWRARLGTTAVCIVLWTLWLCF
jgi:hypothetical protein